MEETHDKRNTEFLVKLKSNSESIPSSLIDRLKEKLTKLKENAIRIRGNNTTIIETRSSDAGNFNIIEARGIYSKYKENVILVIKETDRALFLLSSYLSSSKAITLISILRSLINIDKQDNCEESRVKYHDIEQEMILFSPYDSLKNSVNHNLVNAMERLTTDYFSMKNLVIGLQQLMSELKKKLECSGEYLISRLFYHLKKEKPAVISELRERLISGKEIKEIGYKFVYLISKLRLEITKRAKKELISMKSKIEDLRIGVSVEMTELMSKLITLINESENNESPETSSRCEETSSRCKESS